MLGRVARLFTSPGPAASLAEAVPEPARPAYQGYIDERSTAHVAGWVRNLADPAERVAFEIVVPGPAGARVIHAGIADQFSDVLVQVGVGDGIYAFYVAFEPPLTAAERERLGVRPAGTAQWLELAPELKTAPPAPVAPHPEPVAPAKIAGPFQGYLDERSTEHVAGWARDLADPAVRVELEIVLPSAGGERVLARLRADEFNHVVHAVGIGDGTYAFHHRFAAPLTLTERDALLVRVAGTTHGLELAPALQTAFEPIHHVAMDIVNNCNLRCPFCVYDYEHTNKTELMSDETFDAALRLIPYVTDGNFWLSCLHEATLHPKLMSFIERVPAQYRRKLFYTTNLAKRMPDAYFSALANSGVSHINVSVESLDPAIYEPMRKGARFRIFQENWDKLLAAFAAGTAPPRIRYNIMAYRSNLNEIPSLVEILLRRKAGWQVEIRNTFDEPHIPTSFREAEFLTTAEWAWLQDALKDCAPDEVMLLMPPGGIGYQPAVATAAAVQAVAVAAAAVVAPVPRHGAPARVPRPFNLRVSWDGTMNVYCEEARVPGQPPTHTDYLVTNIKTLADPMATLLAL